MYPSVKLIVPPQSTSQQNTQNIPSDCLGSTPTSEQTHENPFTPQLQHNVSHIG